MPQPKVEFSADSTMESQGMIISSKIYHAANKERMEMNIGDGKSTIMIMRMDKKVSWMLMPEQQMYMETSMEEAKKKSKDYRDCSVQQKPAGGEMVNGVKTSKYKVAMSCPEEVAYDGTMWVTKNGIVMKLDAVAKGGDNSANIKMELKNLKIAKQDPKLFEVPDGYQKMSMGGLFQNIGNIMQKAQEDADKKAAEKKAKKKKKEQASGNSDSGRAYTAKGREYTARGRDYTAKGRDYTAKGRDYTAKGRDYTATPKKKDESESGGFNPIDTIKGWFSW
jgi:hypothetical protein